MSWESSLIYYRLTNQKVNHTLGGHHSAKCILYSLDFDIISSLQQKGEWEILANILIESALSLQRAGSDFIALCTNTMHKIAPQIEGAISIPFLHIGTAIAAEIKAQNIKKAVLIGTKFTMEHDFLKSKIENESYCEIVIPNITDRNTIHDIIYDELVKGIIKEESRIKYLNIVNMMMQTGAQAIILGCTEIGLLLRAQDTEHKLLDTTLIHANSCALLSMH